MNADHSRRDNAIVCGSNSPTHDASRYTLVFQGSEFHEDKELWVLPIFFWYARPASRSRRRNIGRDYAVTISCSALRALYLLWSSVCDRHQDRSLMARSVVHPRLIAYICVEIYEGTSTGTWYTNPTSYTFYNRRVTFGFRVVEYARR